MKTLGNILWFIFGGVFMGLGWWLIGSLAYISIIGIPWGKACFVMGAFAFSPFGKKAINRSNNSGTEDMGTGGWGFLGNVIWFFVFGFWLALGHFISGAVLCITLVGIPFGIQHFKMIGISLAPIGKEIVPINS